MRVSGSRKATVVRKLASVVVAAGLLVSLAACANTSTASAACTPKYATGGNAALVSAPGAFGQDPTATFPTPLAGTKTEVAEVTPGDGAKLLPGQIADFQVTVYNGITGDAITASNYTPDGVVRRLVGGGTDVIGATLQCLTVGSRVVATTTVSSVFGPAGIDPKYGVGVNDQIVLVMDVQRSFPGRANGADQPAQVGFPTVVLAPNGRPGITMPTGNPPADLKVEVLKKGTGTVVKKGDKVVVQYSGVLWDATSTFDTTWDKGTPATLIAQSLTETSDGSGIVPGFATALIGQRVGSQVLVVIPPQLGYPSGSAPASVPDGSTMVFVFDVLGIQ